MAIIYIYALRDPVDGSVFYVGKSKNPKNRYRAHFKSERSISNRHLYEKIHSILRDGSKPLLTILEVTSGTLWRERERWWVAYFRGLRVNLENITAGGDGSNFGHIGPLRDGAERAIRIRKVWREWWDSLTPEQKSAENKEKLTPQAREKIGAAKRGKPLPELHKAAAHAGQLTKEFHDKASLSQRMAWSSKSDKEKVEIVQKRAVTSTATWSTMSPDSRSKRLSGILMTTVDPERQRIRAKSFWNSMSPEQRRIFCEERRLKQIEFYKQRALCR